MHYQGKPLAELDLWALGLLLASLRAKVSAREEASKHSKFRDKKTKLKLPPINPEFLNLINEVELAIRKKQNVEAAT